MEYSPYTGVRCKPFFEKNRNFLKANGETMRNNNPHLLSIGEVAKSLHITRRILLNYEDKGLVHPDVKEGKGGNRYYTTDTVTRIRAIRRLQSLGISLDEIKLYFEDKADLREFIGRLENMRDELDLCIEKLRLRVSESEEDVIEVREIPAQTVYIRRCSTPTVAHRMEIFRQVIPEAMRLYGSDSSKRMFLLAYPLEDTDDTRFCVAVPQGSRGDGVEQWEKERAVSVFFHGDYTDIPRIREKLLDYARQHGLRPKGTCRHIYLEGPAHHSDANKFITQVAMPIE